MKEVMSTDVKEFKEILKMFMQGQGISLMTCVLDNDTEQLVIHGAWDSRTEIEDCMIEVDDNDDDVIVMYSLSQKINEKIDNQPNNDKMLARR